MSYSDQPGFIHWVSSVSLMVGAVLTVGFLFFGLGVGLFSSIGLEEISQAIAAGGHWLYYSAFWESVFVLFVGANVAYYLIRAR
ncbi:hypothetical protein KQI63_05980 [bacterium]|nr:hypothetical protein [bacterium]